MKFVLLVSGKRFVGKDTFCDLLQKKLVEKSITVEKFAAADECKRLFAVENSLDFEKLKNDRDYKEQNRTKLTEFFWKHDLNMFEQLVAKSIFESTASVFIVTDFRFQSQLQHIQSIPDVSISTIRINCDDKTRSERGWIFEERKDNDATENSLDVFSFSTIIENNATVAELEKKVDEIIKKMSAEKVGDYIEFIANGTTINAKIISCNCDCMQAMRVETGTRYLFYKTNGLWCLALQSVSFHAPTKDELEKEKTSYWTRY